MIKKVKDWREEVLSSARKFYKCELKYQYGVSFPFIKYEGNSSIFISMNTDKGRIEERITNKDLIIWYLTFATGVAISISNTIRYNENRS